MVNKSLVTIANHSKEKIKYLIEMAHEFEEHPNRRILEGKIVATLFFEPSTRTRLSFETAANRLGAKVIGFADPKVTSGTKGETLKDTIMMVSNYADVIVMRHSGALLPSGHAQWQNGTPQSIHRLACILRSWVLSVCSTSPKSLIRSCTGLYPASMRGTSMNAFSRPIIYRNYVFLLF